MRFILVCIAFRECSNKLKKKKTDDDILSTKCVVYLFKHFRTSNSERAKMAKEISDQEESLLLIDICYSMLKILLFSACQHELHAKECTQISEHPFSENEETHTLSQNQSASINAMLLTILGINNVDDKLNFSQINDFTISNELDFIELDGGRKKFDDDHFSAALKEWYENDTFAAEHMPLHIAVIIIQKFDDICHFLNQQLSAAINKEDDTQIRQDKNAKQLMWAVRMSGSFLCLNTLISAQYLGDDSILFVSRSLVTCEEFALIQAVTKLLYLIILVGDDSDGVEDDVEDDIEDDFRLTKIIGNQNSPLISNKYISVFVDNITKITTHLAFVIFQILTIR